MSDKNVDNLTEVASAENAGARRAMLVVVSDSTSRTAIVRPRYHKQVFFCGVIISVTSGIQFQVW